MFPHKAWNLWVKRKWTEIIYRPWNSNKNQPILSSVSLFLTIVMLTSLLFVNILSFSYSEFTASLWRRRIKIDRSTPYPLFLPRCLKKRRWNALLIFERGVEEMLKCPVTLTPNKGDKSSLSMKSGREEIAKKRKKKKKAKSVLLVIECMVRWRLWTSPWNKHHESMGEKKGGCLYMHAWVSICECVYYWTDINKTTLV